MNAYYTLSLPIFQEGEGKELKKGYICIFSPRNSDGWQKGFTNVTPDASRNQPPANDKTANMCFSGICDAEGVAQYTSPLRRAAATNITLQV